MSLFPKLRYTIEYHRLAFTSSFWAFGRSPEGGGRSQTRFWDIPLSMVPAWLPHRLLPVPKVFIIHLRDFWEWCSWTPKVYLRKWEWKPFRLYDYRVRNERSSFISCYCVKCTTTTTNSTNMVDCSEPSFVGILVLAHRILTFLIE